MPKTRISEFSLTPANNTDIDGIDIAEGCAPSGINNAIRELMSQLKDFQGGTSGDTLAIAAGGTNAATTTAALQNLGGTTTGINLFKAISSTAARTELGATTVGNDVFTAVDAAAARTAIGAGTGTGDVTTTVQNYVESVVAIGTVSSSHTLSLTNGTVQTATLTASTACTFTMPTATAGKSFVLLLKQAASTGNGTATFTSVKWGTAGAPTITATAGKMDILTFVADGTNWYGSIAQGYTP
jgi:hypothetical protein